MRIQAVLLAISAVLGCSGKEEGPASRSGTGESALVDAASGSDEDSAIDGGGSQAPEGGASIGCISTSVPGQCSYIGINDCSLPGPLYMPGHCSATGLLGCCDRTECPPSALPTVCYYDPNDVALGQRECTEPSPCAGTWVQTPP